MAARPEPGDFSPRKNFQSSKTKVKEKDKIKD